MRMKNQAKRERNVIQKLSGGDLRSIGRANEAVQSVQTQQDFDRLFTALSAGDRRVVMRAADAIEKITRRYPQYLAAHKAETLRLFQSDAPIELRWHLAQLIPRLKLNRREAGKVWIALECWAADNADSKIVRVNALQALSDLLPLLPQQHTRFLQLISVLERERVPSLNARIRRIRKRHAV